MRGAAPKARRGPDRRTRRAPFYFPERRSGFDRRRPGTQGWRAAYYDSLRGFRENENTFLLVLATIVVFNYVDYLLTVRVLRAGGVELNPLMARLFEINAPLAASAKLGSVGLGVLLLLALRRYRRTLEVSLLLLLGFTVLMLYHAYLALQLVG